MKRAANLRDRVEQAPSPPLIEEGDRYQRAGGGVGNHVLNPGHPGPDQGDDTGGSVQAGQETSACQGMATVGCSLT